MTNKINKIGNFDTSALDSIVAELAQLSGFAEGELEAHINATVRDVPASADHLSLGRLVATSRTPREKSHLENCIHCRNLFAAVVPSAAQMDEIRKTAQMVPNYGATSKRALPYLTPQWATAGLVAAGTIAAVIIANQPGSQGERNRAPKALSQLSKPAHKFPNSSGTDSALTLAEVTDLVNMLERQGGTSSLSFGGPLANCSGVADPVRAASFSDLESSADARQIAAPLLNIMIDETVNLDDRVKSVEHGVRISVLASPQRKELITTGLKLAAMKADFDSDANAVQKVFSAPQQSIVELVSAAEAQDLSGLFWIRQAARISRSCTDGERAGDADEFGAISMNLHLPGR